MDRRDFLKHSAAAFAASSVPAYAEQLADTRKRVGLIGAGWYGKTDLLRLIQVAPVDVVSLCDVDRNMLADAADQVAARQAPTCGSRSQSASTSSKDRRCWPRRASTNASSRLACNAEARRISSTRAIA